MDKDLDYECYSTKWDDSTPSYQQRNYNKVLFSRAIKLSSSNPDLVYLYWGNQYLDLDDHSNTIRKFKRVIAIDQNDYQTTMKIAALLEKADKHEEALIYFFQALNISPTLFEAHTRILGIFKLLDRFKEVEPQYQKFLNASSKIQSNPIFHSVFYFAKAEALIEFNEYPAALPNYQKAIEISSDKPDFHFQYAMALYHETFYQEALEEFERVVQIQPTHDNAFNNAAFMKYNLSNVAEAISDLESIIENNREIYTTYSNMILFKYHLEQNEDVIQPYIERLKPYLAFDGQILKEIYEDDMQLAERKLTEDLDEKTKDFNLRRLSGLKFVLSLIK